MTIFDVFLGSVLIILSELIIGRFFDHTTNEVIMSSISGIGGFFYAFLYMTAKNWK